MSPEQAEGNLDKLGPPSDVYSLGAMLYTLLSGKPAFEYAWCEVTTLIARVKNGEFPPPRQVNPRVPRPLEAICLKAMATSPEGRYPDAEALAGEIERWLADEPVAAYREPRWARLARWGRRHRPLVTGATGLLVAAVAGLTLGIILLGRAQRETEAQRQAAVREREVATFLSEESKQRAETLRRRDYINRVNLAYREYLDDNAALSDQYLYGCPSALRNWEWSHVHRLGHVDLDTFVTGDPTQRFDIWSLAFSPDGKRLASGAGPWFQAQSGPTGGLVVRDVETGRELFARRGWPGAVQAVAYSPDGKSLLAATGTTGTTTGAVLTCHDAATGELRWRAEEKDINILGLAYSPDGKTIASGCGGFNNYDGIGYVRLRHAATGDADRRQDPRRARRRGRSGVQPRREARGAGQSRRGRRLGRRRPLSRVPAPRPPRLRLRRDVQPRRQVDRLGRLGPDDPPLGPKHRQAGADDAGAPRLRPRARVPARQPAAPLGQRGQERAALGRRQRPRARRLPRAHRVRPLRGVQPRRRRGGLGEPGRHDQALAGGGARPARPVPQRLGLGRHRGVPPERPPGRDRAQRQHPGLGPADRRGALARHRPARAAGPDRPGVHPRRQDAGGLGPGRVHQPVGRRDGQAGARARPRVVPGRRRGPQPRRHAPGHRRGRRRRRLAGHGHGGRDPDVPGPPRRPQRPGLQPRRHSASPPPPRTARSRCGTSPRARSSSP